MYAVRHEPALDPVVVRLVGVLDDDLVLETGRTLRALGGPRTALVDVRDLTLVGEAEMLALAQTIAAARAAGLDARLDGGLLPWRNVARRVLSRQRPVDEPLRRVVRRTVIIAHSGRRRRR